MRLGPAAEHLSKTAQILIAFVSLLARVGGKSDERFKVVSRANRRITIRGREHLQSEGLFGEARKTAWVYLVTRERQPRNRVNRHAGEVGR